jgi:hypothetical protein
LTVNLKFPGDTDGQKQIPDADGDFSHAPIFNFNDGKVKFDANRVDNANDNYGSASGFLPKSFLNTEMPSDVISEGIYFIFL